MGKTIMVVDDHQSIRSSLRDLLLATIPGCRIIEAADGEEAIELADTKSPDMVIMDIGLPGIDGIETTKIIHDRKPELKVVMLSIHEEDEYRHEAKLAGASDYVSKRNMYKDLVPAVKRALKETEERNDRRRAEKELLETHDQMRHLLDHTPAVIYSLKIEGQSLLPVFISENITRLLGYSAAESSHYAWWFDNLHPEDRDRVLALVSEGMKGQGYTVEYRFRAKDGAYHWFEDNNRVVRDESGEPRQAIGIWTDITERKQKENDLRRLNRTLQARSKSSKAMMSARDEVWYLNEVCRIIVEDCGHALVWIGYAEQDEGRTVRPVAHAGFEEDYLRTLEVTWADTERGRGPVGTAIRTGKPTVFRSMAADPRFAPWREEAVKRGYAAVVSIPLLDDGKAFGNLNIYSRQEDPFSDDEVQLLTDLAADLSYGVAAIRLSNAQTKAESALRESEVRLRTLLQTIPDLVWLKDANGVYLACNPTFERFFGARVADIIGKTDYDFVKRDLADVFREHDRRAMAAGKLTSKEDWITFADDGHRALMDTIKTPMYDAGGNITGVLGIARDITDRKRAEEELRFKNVILAAQQETAIDGILLVDGEGRILSYNTRFVDMWGIASEILETKSDERLLPSVVDIVANPEEFISKVQYLYGAREEKSRDEISLKDGRTFDRYSAPMWSSDGKYYGRIWYFRDITERKKAETALATSEAQFRKLYQEFHGLLDAVPDSLMLLDKDLKVLWANRVAADFIGADPGAIIGQYCHSLWYRRTTPCDPCPVMESFSTGRPMSVTVTRPDGRIFDIRTVPVSDEGGGIARVIEVVREITEHRKLEAQYLQAQKMESIGTLAGGVAHDFNNILSAIIGYGHVTLMKMANNDPLRSNIEHMLDAADRAARLTKELLLFSRKHESERKPVDVNEVVSMVEKFLRMVIGEDIACKTMLQERSLPVYADSHQLEQVLMNLATNARDAMPGGGALTIKTEQIDLAEDFIKAHGYGKSGPYAMMTISDSGMGMDETTRAHIFEPFFTTKEVGKGTGLGLAVVYGIIKQHDGFVNVYSEPGKGTTFRIYLPIIGAVVTEETKTQHREAPARGTETVLVAEDDENLRKLSRTVLKEYGYTVIDAVDGEEAVKKFMENKDTIQLLLFDLIMPKMNGKEAADEIKKIKPGMKVLFASGYDPDLLQQKELLGDEVHLVYKPISPMDLLRKVRSVLDGVSQ